MATARPMAQQQNNKKYGGLMQDACFTDGMVDHDMHLKMSKKIAQLTKVIYALNTKNDEHEHIVKSLQQQHDTEKSQLLQETRLRVDGLQRKLGAEGELRERINSLETSVEEHEKQKKRLLHEFDAFKGLCADNEIKLKSESSQKVTSLSKELQQSQNQFQVQFDNFESLIDAFGHQRNQAIEDLQKAHKAEFANLLKVQQSELGTRELELTSELESLKSKYKNHVEQSEAAFNDLKTTKEVMEEDYIEKLKKSRLFYEKELELLQQRTNEVDADKQKRLEGEIDKLTKDYRFQEAQYKHRIDKLLNDLSLSEDTINGLKTDIGSINDENSKVSEERDSIRVQLESMRKDVSEVTEKYREAEREVQVIRQRCSDQSDQLVKKSGVIGELNAAKMEKESQLQLLAEELSDVSRQLKILQEEKNSLLWKTNNDAQQKSLEVQALEQALKDVRIEKKAQSEKYQADIAILEQLLEEEKVKSNSNLREQLAEMKDVHAREIQSLREQEQAKLKDLEQVLNQQMVEEISRLDGVNAELKATLTAEILELQRKLEHEEDELEKMQTMVGDTSDNLGAATSELSELKRNVSTLRQQLDAANSQLRSTNSQLVSLEDKAKKLELSNGQLIKDHTKDLKSKLEDQNKSLEISWLEKLRKETVQLKLDLDKQFASDKASAMRHLQDQRDSEIQKLMMESESKLHQLMMQIANLERNLHNEQSSGVSKIDSLTSEYEQQIQDLTNELKRLTQEYEEKSSNLSASLESEWQMRLKSQTEQLETSILKLKNKHIEDMKAQMTAHKATIDMTRREADDTLIFEVDKLKSSNLEDKNALIASMGSEHKRQLEMQNQGSIKQVAALKMELQRAVELTKRKEGELQLMQEENGEKLGQRDRNISLLESELKKLQENIQILSAEIEIKKKEVERAKSEASKQMRQREEFLAQEHGEEMEQLQAHHADETQQMLSDFTKAQAILKEKIEDLSLLLEEAEERYLNREPREEDLNMIEQLRRMLTQREQEMQQLLADKQFYQMELVNRETNFTKVFAGGKGGPQQPQVGFINPLAKKKKGEKGPTKYAVNVGAMEGGISGSNSANSTTQRLRPIAGSPIHDERLNPNNVLPAPSFPSTFTKKFVQ